MGEVNLYMLFVHSEVNITRGHNLGTICNSFAGSKPPDPTRIVCAFLTCLFGPRGVGRDTFLSLKNGHALLP